MPQQENYVTHLYQDVLLKGAMSRVEITIPETKTDVFVYLVRSIVSQQLSVKSAKSIYSRFVTLVGSEIHNPDYITSLDVSQLRAVGFSNQKAGYVKNVCSFFSENKLRHVDWSTKSDLEFINLLTKIKGVGVWTCQMVLIFALLREDVFPPGDLSIQQAMQKLYNLKSEKKALLKDMETIADQWSPYRSIASLYLWRYNDL